MILQQDVWRRDLRLREVVAEFVSSRRGVLYARRPSSGVAMAYTVIWYGRQGIVEKTSFDAERAAKDHAIATFDTRKQSDGIVSVEVRKDNGAVVFSKAG